MEPNQPQTVPSALPPLELRIHPLFQDRQGEDWYVWQGTGVRPYIADTYALNKNLTDAELSAEMWRAAILADKAPIGPARQVWPARAKVLERFARADHYDQDAA